MIDKVICFGSRLILQDGSKYITAEELKEFFMGPDGGKEWDDALWKLLVREVDANSDGQVQKL